MAENEKGNRGRGGDVKAKGKQSRPANGMTSTERRNKSGMLILYFPFNRLSREGH